jgi:uncharacterized paraquat-inducible protein A
MQRRHQGSWSLDLNSTGLIFVGLLLLSPWLMFAVFNSDGLRTSPGLRALIVVVGGVVLFACHAGYKASRSKLWRARRRKPWWFRGLRAGPARSCAYCHGDLGGEAEVSCPACAGTYHAECQSELGRCASLGCAGLGGAPQVAAPQKVTLVSPKVSA